jgi:chloride channel 7
VDGAPADSAAFQAGVDLTPYVNSSAPAVPEGFSLERAYRMFRQLGLRHLVVTDAHNRVKGMLTRKVRLLCAVPATAGFFWGVLVNTREHD